MTSRRFSNKSKGSAYTFRSGIRSAFIPALLQMIVMLVFMAVIPAVRLYEKNKSILESNTQNGTAKKLTDAFNYLILSDSSITGAVLLLFIAALSVLTGIIVFRFTADKRTVNVYYSLGIKRKSLYLSRYFAGGVLLCLSVMIAVTVSFIVNLIFLKLTWQLSVALLYYYLGLSLFSLLCFTVTAACFSCVGTISEGIMFAGGVLISPTVVLFALEKFMTSFLSGNPYNANLNNSYGYDLSSSLIFQFTKINPLLYFYNDLKIYSASYPKDGKFTLSDSTTAWLFPAIDTVLPWFFVIIAVAVGGMFLFKARKAETCGFIGTNKVFNNLLIFELMLTGFSLALSFKDNSGTVKAIVAGIIISAVIYSVTDLILKRNFRQFGRGLVKLPAHLAALCIITVIFMTGGFGYENKIPDNAKITSVTISSPTDFSLVDTKNNYYGSWNLGDGIITVSTLSSPSLMGEMTSSTDIAYVRSLHKDLIACADKTDGNFSVPLYITYKLKDGSAVSRYYTSADAETLNEILGAFDSDYYEAALTKYVSGSVKGCTNDEYYSDNTEYSYENYCFACFDPDLSTVYSYTKSMSDYYRLNLTPAQIKALEAALVKDLTAMTAQEYYSGTARQIGYLRFQTNINSSEETEYEELSEMLSYTEVSPNMQNELMGYTGDGSRDIVITEGMTNTIAFINANGLSDCFTSRLTVKSVSFLKYNIEDYFGSRSYYMDNAMPDYEFTAHNVYSYDPANPPKPEDSMQNIITDAAKINEILSLTRLHQYTYDTGYWCCVAYTNGTLATLYIPEATAPQYVKDYNYTMNIDNVMLY